MNFRRDEKLYQPHFNPKWNKCILYELADWFNGFAFKSSHFSEKGKPIIKIAELKNDITEQTKFTDQEFDKVILVKKGDLLFSWSGQPEKSIDVFWWKGPEGWLNQHIFKVIPKNCDKKFLYYLLKYLRPNFIDIARNKQTTGLGHVTKKDLQRIIVGLPPLPEQKAIAHILGTLDDKIELNRRMNETLEEMPKAIFKSWFVDFDPVIDNALKAGNPIPDALAEKAARRRAILEKLEKEDPNLPKLSPEIARLFPDSFEDSPLGPVPRGWRVDDVYSIAEVFFGAPFSSKFFNEEGKGLPILRIRDLKTHNPQIYTTEIHPKARIVKLGSIVVGMDGEFTAQIWKGPPSLLNQRVCEFVPKKRVPELFIKFSLEKPLQHFENSKIGTTVIHLNKKDIDSFKIVVPDDPILDIFYKGSTEIYREILHNSKQNRLLVSIRDTLLPKLISGQIRIKDAEKIGEGVL